MDEPADVDLWLTTALSSWATPSRRGEVFGPGFGFEEAQQVLRALRTPEWVLQGVASEVADSLIRAVRSGSTNLDQYDDALGLTVSSLRRHGVARRKWQALLDPVDASKDTLVGLATMDGEKLQKMHGWFDSDQTRRDHLIYHFVGARRLGLG